MKVNTHSCIGRLFHTATQTKTRTALSLTSILAITWLAHHHLKPEGPPPNTNINGAIISYSGPTIMDYDQTHDFKTVVKLFQDNWHDLVYNSDFDTDSEKQLLYLKTLQLGPAQHKEKIHIKVIHDDNNAVIGFISYYTYNDKNSCNQDILCGKIHHLIVARKFRKKGLGARLLKFATVDLKRMGATMVTLSTVNQSVIPFFKKYKFERYRSFFSLDDQGTAIPTSYMLIKPLPYIPHLDNLTPP